MNWPTGFRFGLALCLFATLGCAFAFSPPPGKKCKSDSNCKSGSECLGGFCSGGSCICTNGNCDCKGDWECRESTAPFSTGVCYLPCSDDEDCPETWSCVSEECTYSPS